VRQIAGGHDFVVRAAVRDADHLRDLAMDRVTSWNEVDPIETALIYDHWRNPVLPAMPTGTDRAEEEWAAAVRGLRHKGRASEARIGICVPAQVRSLAQCDSRGIQLARSRRC